MPIHPTIQQILDSYPVVFPDELTPELIINIRKTAIITPVEMRPSVYAIEDHVIQGPNGDIPIRIYCPEETSSVYPAIVYFHGGGWSIGSIEGHDVICRQLTNYTRCKVISVDYRLAPENRFPKGLIDCYTITEWVFAHAKELQIDENRIAVGGDSAGGNLTAAVTLLAREGRGPVIWKQILIYPSVDALRCIEESPYKSIHENANAPILTSKLTKSFWDHYLKTEEDSENVYASPIREKDLSGLPEALIITAEFDPIRDEGELYALRLKESGVPIQVTRFNGLIHGFLSFPTLDNKEVYQLIANFLHEDK